MKIYKYKFCDGIVSEIEVSDMEYALLKEMDKRVQNDNLSYARECVSLETVDPDEVVYDDGNGEGAV